MLKLDYTLDSPQERLALVNQILAETPDVNPEPLADYLILCMEKQEKRERAITTENRLATINRRETSLEGLISKLENGEDGIYNLISDNNKNAIFRPKVAITPLDLAEIPLLAQLRSAIESWEALLPNASGREAYIIKNALIEMRKDQYIIKNAYRRPITPNKLSHSSTIDICYDDLSTLRSPLQEVSVQGVSLLNPAIVSAILCNYSRLKEDSWDRFTGDTWYLMQSFDELADRALAAFPLYDRIVEYKIDGLSNLDIQTAIQQEFGIRHTVEYISSLWRNKIPKLIAQKAKEDFVIWQFNLHNWPMKKCSRCGQSKPMYPLFFSKNNTSKDGWYSICKECRNKKKG